MTAASETRQPHGDRLEASFFAWRRVIPVITIERVEDAVPLARALVSGGLRLLEITLRTRSGARCGRRDHRRGA